ncbi:hypothetical protein CTI12_AA367730 [Artemisia annua]|uniref:Uncharacterized protein n=1 Tax=Artemisia annua TaxID=35608 RepID=A0A2U1M9X0_ARTAN|nr:hypothetical protein CTI12_AA367730 [Artemisia annua]
MANWFAVVHSQIHNAVVGGILPAIAPVHNQIHNAVVDDILPAIAPVHSQIHNAVVDAITPEKVAAAADGVSKGATAVAVCATAVGSVLPVVAADEHSRSVDPVVIVDPWLKSPHCRAVKPI